MRDVPTSGDPMEALHALQIVDDALDRLKEEQESSPLLDKVEEARAQLEARSLELERARAKENALRKQLRRLELDLEKAAGEIAGVEAKLFGGEVRSAKELANLQERHAALLSRRERLEDEVLAAMEAVEAAEEAAAGAGRAAERAAESLAAAEGELSKARQAWEAKARRLAEERAAAASRVDPLLLERYESLRLRMPRPIAKVESRTCSGCHLAFPTAMKAPAPGELSQCPHCGRLLWWPGGS